MLGAAIATAGEKAGIVCILGTGSNSCLYDGSKIVDNIPALGFALIISYVYSKLECLWIYLFELD